MGKCNAERSGFVTFFPLCVMNLLALDQYLVEGEELRPHRAKQIHRHHLWLYASFSKTQFADVHVYGPAELKFKSWLIVLTEHTSFLNFLKSILLEKCWK